MNKQATVTILLVALLVLSVYSYLGIQKAFADVLTKYDTGFNPSTTGMLNSMLTGNLISTAYNNKIVISGASSLKVIDITGMTITKSIAVQAVSTGQGIIDYYNGYVYRTVKSASGTQFLERIDAINGVIINTGSTANSGNPATIAIDRTSGIGYIPSLAAGVVTIKSVDLTQPTFTFNTVQALNTADCNAVGFMWHLDDRNQWLLVCQNTGHTTNNEIILYNQSFSSVVARFAPFTGSQFINEASYDSTYHNLWITNQDGVSGAVKGTFLITVGTSSLNWQSGFSSTQPITGSGYITSGGYSKIAFQGSFAYAMERVSDGILVLYDRSGSFNFQKQATYYLDSTSVLSALASDGTNVYPMGFVNSVSVYVWKGSITALTAGITSTGNGGTGFCVNTAPAGATQQLVCYTDVDGDGIPDASPIQLVRNNQNLTQMSNNLAYQLGLIADPSSNIQTNGIGYLVYLVIVVIFIIIIRRATSESEVPTNMNYMLYIMVIVGSAGATYGLHITDATIFYISIFVAVGFAGTQIYNKAFGNKGGESG